MAGLKKYQKTDDLFSFTGNNLLVNVRAIIFSNTETEKNNGYIYFPKASSAMVPMNPDFTFQKKCEMV